MAYRLADGLVAARCVGEVDFASASHRVDSAAAALASCYDVTVRTHLVDGRDVGSIANVLRRHPPDLVIQAAALMSPWALGGRNDPTSMAVASAGLGIRLPLQIPVLMATMQAVRDVGFAGPVANLSFPDATHPLLNRLALAPTVGLGNVAMYVVRARAALRAERGADAVLPLIRVAGQHGHVYGVMNATRPPGSAAGPWVWLDDPAERADDLAYAGTSIAPSEVFNAVTAASSLPILQALLPGADELRWSAPGPLGLAGGYPVRIRDGNVRLDLPDAVTLAECQQMCAAAASIDGIERIDDGVVYFTEAARAAVADVAPDLAEPLTIADAAARADRLLALLR